MLLKIFYKIKKNDYPETQRLCEMFMSNEPLPDYGIKAICFVSFQK